MNGKTVVLTDSFHCVSLEADQSTARHKEENDQTFDSIGVKIPITRLLFMSYIAAANVC